MHSATCHLSIPGLLIRASPMSMQCDPCVRPRKLQTDGVVDREHVSITVSKGRSPLPKGLRVLWRSEAWWTEASRACPVKPKDLGIHRINPTWTISDKITWVRKERTTFFSRGSFESDPDGSPRNRQSFSIHRELRPRKRSWFDLNHWVSKLQSGDLNLNTFPPNSVHSILLQTCSGNKTGVRRNCNWTKREIQPQSFLLIACFILWTWYNGPWV